VIVPGSGFFAVLAELRQMQERISLIEAKLAQSKQSTVHPSSEHSSSVVQTTADQLPASQRSQNSAQINHSLLRPSSTVGTDRSSHTCSVTTPKAQVSAKPGMCIIIRVHSVLF